MAETIVIENSATFTEEDMKKFLDTLEWCETQEKKRQAEFEKATGELEKELEKAYERIELLERKYDDKTNSQLEVDEVTSALRDKLKRTEGAVEVLELENEGYRLTLDAKEKEFLKLQKAYDTIQKANTINGDTADKTHENYKQLLGKYNNLKKKYDEANRGPAEDFVPSTCGECGMVWMDGSTCQGTKCEDGSICDGDAKFN